MKDSVKTVFRFEHLKMLEPYLEQVRNDFQGDCIGIDVGITYSKGKGVHVSFYPATEHGFWMDGRNMYWEIDQTLTRFNQKRFDEIVEKWKQLLPHMATLYTFIHMLEYGDKDAWSAVMNVICTLMPDVKAAQDAAVGQIKLVIDNLIKADVLEEITSTTNNNQQEMETPSIQPGVTIATPETETKLANRLNAAIANDGDCVHNCSREDEEWKIPLRCKIRELHPDCNPEQSTFVGWPGFKRGVMIDFSVGANVALYPGKMRENGFTPEFIDFVANNGTDLLDKEGVAIRIELEESKFLEYLINKSVA